MPESLFQEELFIGLDMPNSQSDSSLNPLHPKLESRGDEPEMSYE